MKHYLLAFVRPWQSMLSPFSPAIDRDVLSSTIARLWSVISGGIILFAIPIGLSPGDQGIYFSFSSVIMLQVFAELGLGQVISQLAAHEVIHHGPSVFHLNFDEERTLFRLTAIRDMFEKWYSVAACIFLPVTLFVGVSLFNKTLGFSSHWFWPWLLIVSLTAMSLSQIWKLALFEGFGFVSQVNFVRLASGVISFILLLFMLLFFKAGLISFVSVPLVNVTVYLCWLKYSKHTNLFFKHAHANPAKDDFINIFSWRSEVFPLQWRYALSWISGFFIFYMFTPLVLYFNGPIEAGKIGFVLSAFTSASGVAISILVAKVPRMSFLISQNRLRDAKRLFFALGKISLITSFFVFLGLTLFLLVCSSYPKFPFAGRLPDPLATLFISIALFGNSVVACAACFMRAHKEEPMLVQSIVFAFITLALSIISIRVSVNLMFFLFALTVWGLCVPWSAILLRSYLHRYQPIILDRT